MTPQDQLKQIMDALQKNAYNNAKSKADGERNAFLTQMGQYFNKAFNAALLPMKEAVDEMRRIGSNLGILSSRLNALEIPSPEVKVDLSSLRIPQPNVTVKPIVDISTIKMPDEMNVKGWMGLMGYDRGLLNDPLPVQLRDSKGNPIKLFDNLTQVIGGGGGGGNHVIVDSMPSISVTSTGNSSISLVNADGTYYNSDNPLPISGSFTASGLQASGAVDSVNILQIASNPAVVGSGYQDNALRVVLATDAVNSVSIAGNIAALDVKQVSGSIDSVNVMQIAGNAAVVGSGYQDNALRVVHATDAIASVSIAGNVASLDIKQVSGSIDSVNVNQINGNTIVVGTGYQDNALRVVHATDAVASVSIVSNIAALDTKQVSGSVDSVSVQGVAMTTNPTAVSDAAASNIKTDKLGRLLARPVQARELISTAYVSVTNGTEATLLAGVAGAYLDCIMIVGSNNSDAAVSVDIRAVTAGNIVHTLRIPANATAGWTPHVPWPQDATGNNWTVDGPDETGRTLTFSALFSKEI